MSKMTVPEAVRLPSGSWHIRLRLDGKSIYVTKLTKKETEQAAALIKAEWRANKRLEQFSEKPKQLTLRQAMQARIDSMSINTSPATIRGYTIAMNHRFVDYVDMIPDDVNWQKLVDDESMKYKPKSVKNAFAFLKSALKQQGYIVPDVKLPQAKRSERPFLEPDDILRVIEELKGRKYEIPALLALHSLRRSEIMALDWSDIDMETKTIHVHGSCVQDKDNKLVKRDVTKTEASQRTIPIMIPRLVEAINELENPSGAVWSGTPCALYRTMEDVCKKLGIENVGAHGLRHSFASLAYSLGMSEIETADIGGWDDLGTMHNIYTHLAKKDRLKATNKMADFYAQSNSASNTSFIEKHGIVYGNAKITDIDDFIGGIPANSEK